MVDAASASRLLRMRAPLHPTTDRVDEVCAEMREMFRILRDLAEEVDLMLYA